MSQGKGSREGEGDREGEGNPFFQNSSTADEYHDTSHQCWDIKKSDHGTGPIVRFQTT